MLNKLTTLPTILRLSLSLLASAGIHGGVAYYDWATQPAAVHDGRSAVAVALVPATEVPSFAVDTPKTSEKQNTEVAELQAMSQSPSGLSATSAMKPFLPTPSKPKIAARQVTESVEEPADNILPPDPICIEPLQSLPDHRAEAASITGDTAPCSPSGVADLPAQMAQRELTDGRQVAGNQTAISQAAEPQEEARIEAVPDYRNNPLPEYPLIARQRHWQGVVWLLVDVSAKGLVDAVDLEQSCGYRVLDRAASRAVQRWEFTPAKRAGLPVASQVRIPVRFSLEGS